MKKNLLLLKVFICFLIAFTSQKSFAQCFGVRSSIQSDFNASKIAAGNTIWFTAVCKVSNVSSYPVTISFQNQSVTNSSFTVSIPNSKLVLTNAVTTATTTFNGTEWITTAPPNCSGNYFLSGGTFTAPAGGLPGSIKPVTWSGNFTSSVPSAKVNWQWAASIYTSFNSNYDLLGVKPTDDNQKSAYKNSDHAGTAENYKSYLVSGARGGGGSNYTGSYSGTASALPSCCTNIAVASTNGTYFCATAGTNLIATGADSYYWLSNGTSGSTLSVPNGQGGTFTVVGSNENGCTGSASISLQVDPTITVSAGNDTTVIEGQDVVLHATVGGGYSFDPMCLTWTGPNGFVANVTGSVGVAPADVTIYSITAAQSGVYVVQAYDCFGSACTAYDSLNVTVVSPKYAGLAPGKFSLYPNPAHGKATLNFNSINDGVTSVKITDATGRVLIERSIEAVKGFNTAEFELESFAKGIYFLNVTTQNKTEVVRLLVD